MPNITVRTSSRRPVTVVTPPNTTVGVQRAPYQAHLDDLQDVNLEGLPEPYPGNLNWNLDEKYELVYDPTVGEWIATPVPIVIGIDGGTY